MNPAMSKLKATLNDALSLDATKREQSLMRAAVYNYLFSSCTDQGQSEYILKRNGLLKAAESYKPIFKGHLEELIDDALYTIQDIASETR